jgi:membrane-associated phospholipid phosphatase
VSSPDSNDRAASPLRPLIAAGLGVVALVLVGALALGSTTVRLADINARLAFQHLAEHQHVERIFSAITDVGDPLGVAIVTAVLAAVAIARGRPRTALGVGLIVLGANVTTQILKPTLARPPVTDVLSGSQILAGSWPSGHATAAMSLALCAVLVSAPRWRPAVATAGAAFAIAVGYGLLILGSHFPSDVLGGYLVAAVWVLAGAAALRAVDRRWPARTTRTAALRLDEALTPPLAAAAAAVGAAVLAVLLRPDAILGEGARHPSAVAAAVAVGAFGLSVATALVLALRR